MNIIAIGTKINFKRITDNIKPIKIADTNAKGIKCLGDRESQLLV